MNLNIGGYTFFRVLHPVQYSETSIENTYQNASGNAIVYPVRAGQKKLQLSVETDRDGMQLLCELLRPSELYIAVGRYIGDFRKISEVTVSEVSETVTVSGNCYAHNGITKHMGAGVYTVSVSLEEV